MTSKQNDAFAEITIRVPREIGIRRGGGTCVVDVTKVHPGIWGRIVEHAFNDKVGDAAAGVKADLKIVDADGKAIRDDDLTAEQIAQVADRASEMMAAVRDNNLYAGLWTVKRAAADPIAVYRRKVLRVWMQHSVFAKQAKAYKVMKGDTKGREEFLDQWFADMDEAHQAKVNGLAHTLWDRDDEARRQERELFAGVDMPDVES